MTHFEHKLGQNLLRKTLLSKNYQIINLFFCNNVKQPFILRFLKFVFQNLSLNSENYKVECQKIFVQDD